MKRIIKTTLSPLKLGIAALLITGSANAATIARFDLGQSAEPGWALITTSSLAATQNGVTLTTVPLTGIDSRTRGGVPTNVAEDFLFNNNTITFTFTGLLPNQEYDFLTYAYDNTGGGAETANWYVGSIAPANLQHTWLNSSDSIQPFTLNGTSDGSGSLVVIVNSPTGTNNRANGFEVVLVPEPSTTLLSGLGLLAFLLRRRR